MATILCFGDSNTWGISPSGKRYNEVERWTALLAKAFLGQHTVIEAGQPNRTVVHNAPFSEEESDNQPKVKSGIRYLKPYLIEYQPEVVLILLGTNDLKRRYDLTTREIGQGMHRLVNKIIHFEYADKTLAPKVLIIAPPPIHEVGTYTKIYAGAAEKSVELAQHYSNIAQILGCKFFDAGSVIKSCPVEGVHWQIEQHALLTKFLKSEINKFIHPLPLKT